MTEASMPSLIMMGLEMKWRLLSVSHKSRSETMLADCLRERQDNKEPEPIANSEAARTQLRLC
jgi:hypothetical protein